MKFDECSSGIILLSVGRLLDLGNKEVIDMSKYMWRYKNKNGQEDLKKS